MDTETARRELDQWSGKHTSVDFPLNSSGLTAALAKAQRKADKLNTR